MKIEISGNYGEGKTTLATLIYQLLVNEGFVVEVEDEVTTEHIKRSKPIIGKGFLNSRNVQIVVRNELSEAPSGI